MPAPSNAAATRILQSAQSVELNPTKKSSRAEETRSHSLRYTFEGLTRETISPFTAATLYLIKRMSHASRGGAVDVSKRTYEDVYYGL